MYATLALSMVKRKLAGRHLDDPDRSMHRQVQPAHGAASAHSRLRMAWDQGPLRAFGDHISD